MRVNNLPCKVVATLIPKRLSLSGQDQDDTIILPYTTAQKKLKGITWLERHIVFGGVARCGQDGRTGSNRFTP
jgi:hypothetical protein